MSGTERTAFLLGQLSERIARFPDLPAWIIRRRISACAALAAADFEASTEPDDLLRLVLRHQAGEITGAAGLHPGVGVAIGYAILQELSAGPSAPSGRRRGLSASNPHNNHIAAWLTLMRYGAMAFREAERGLTALAAAAWEIGGQDIRRSALMVALSTEMGRRYELGPEVPGLWGALPRPSEGRVRFGARFISALAAQAEVALRDMDEVARLRAAGEKALVGIRSNSRLPLALTLLIERRVISPALLAETIGSSLRGASKILDEMAARKIAIEVTARRNYRRFAHVLDLPVISLLMDAPPMAANIAVQAQEARLGGKVKAQGISASQGLDQSLRQPLPPTLPQDLEEFAEESLAGALAAADVANERIQSLLSRMGQERRQDRASENSDPGS